MITKNFKLSAIFLPILMITTSCVAVKDADLLTQEGNASVSGKVLDKSSQAPIEGAKVYTSIQGKSY